ncbi:MAG: class I SAM-dependent methyltransferase [Verrucomicrobiota bacterium]
MSAPDSKERFRPSALSGETELHPGEWEALCDRVARLEVSGRIVEVGTAAGGTMVKLLQALPVEKHSSVSVVDTFEYFPDHLQIWQDNLRQNGFDPGVIELLQGASMDGYRTASGRGERLAFVLVDAGHKLKDVIRDVQWLSLLEVGGVGAFHDYSERFPGVMLAVDTFLDRNPEFEREALVGTLMFVRKMRDTDHEVMPAWLMGWMTFRSLLMQWGKSLRKRLPGTRGRN